MKIISVANCKGGVAKTTTALCLASYLSSMGHRSLVLDLDPQANATSSLLRLEVGQNPQGTNLHDVIYALVMKQSAPAISDAVVGISDTLSIVPAVNDLEQMKDLVITRMHSRLQLISRLLRPIADQFDFVLIDCPPDLSIYVESAISLSDLILLPTTYDKFSFEGVAQVIGAIKELREDRPALYRVLYTMVNPQATRIRQAMGTYEQLLNQTGVVLPFAIPVDQSVKNAQAADADLLTGPAYRNSRARLRYQQLGEYVTEALT